jgi:hypothetical protein
LPGLHSVGAAGAERTDNKELAGKGVYNVIYPEVIPFHMDMFIR